MRRITLAILCLVMAFSIAKAQITNDDCEQAIEVFCGGEVEVDFGEERSDATWVTGCGYDSSNESVWYKFVGTGKLMSITLCGGSSNYLHVFDGTCARMTCVESFRYSTVYPEECGSGYSRQVTFSSREGEEYYILCSTRNPSIKGTLYIECLEPIANDVCETAQAVEIDSTITYNHINASSSEFISCNASSPSNSKDSWYSFEGTGDLLKIEGSESSRSETLYKGSCSQFKCIPSELINGTRAYQTERGKTYYLQVFSNQSVAYNFTLKAVNIVENDECEQAIPILAGDTISVSFVDTRSSPAICRGSGSTNDVWYSFEGNDSILNIRHLEGSFYSRVVSGDCDELICQSLTWFHPTSTYSVLTKKGTQYFINISKNSYSNSTSFKFSTYSFEPVENDNYSSALPINCQDTVRSSLVNAQNDFEINGRNEPSVWYTLTGTGEFYKATSGFEGRSSYYSPRLHFYKEVENVLVSAGVYSNAYIYFEEGITYYVDVISDDYEDLFWLKLSCAPKIPHDLCDEAKTFELQDTTTLEGGFGYGRIDDGSTCSSGNRGDTWYQMEGNDKYYDIKFDIYNTAFNYKFSIYEGSCDTLNCLAAGRYSSYTTRIFFEEGKQYYVQIYSSSTSWSEDATFDLIFETLPTAPNDLCAGATMLEDGIEITDSLDHAAANDPTCSDRSSYPGLWYQLEGDDKYYTFDISLKRNYYSSSYYPARSNITLFEGNCDELTCVDNQSILSYYQLTFFAEKGKSYFLNYHYSTQYDINIKVSSSEYIDNDDISNAILVTCDSSYTGYTNANTYQAFDGICENASNSADIWFKIIGNDEYVDFNSSSIEEIYTFEDGTLSCFKGGSEDDILLEAGKEYYIRYITENYINQYNFTVQCYPIVTNSNCSNAIELSCGDEYTVNTFYAERNGISNRICGVYFNSDIRTVWYKITGDDTWKKLLTENANFKLYEGKCDEFVCLDNSNTFFAEEGKEYYLRIYSIYGYYGILNVSMSCGETPINDFCEQAEIISCGDTIQASLDFATGCENLENCNAVYSSSNREKNIWYSIAGTGGMIDLSITENSSYHVRNYSYITVYEQDCCSKKRVENTYGSTRALSFYGRDDVNYLVAVNTDRYDFTDKNFELAVSCDTIDTSIPNICENAIALTQQAYEIDLDDGKTYFNHNYSTGSAEMSWIQFEGSGGIDTVKIDYSIGNLRNVDTRLYIDVNDNCDLMALYNSHALLYGYETRSIIIPTIKDMKYVIAVSSSSSYYSDKRISVVLNPSNEDNNPCSLVLPESTELSYGYNLRIPFNISSESGSFDVYVLDHENKSSRIRYNDLLNGEFFNLSPTSSGTTIIEFNGDEGCYGHGLLNVEVTDLPRDPCSDETFLCEELIEHFDDEELTDSIYQALSIESSAIISLEANVEYLAEKEVLLLPGFETEDDSDFTADIVECEVAEDSQEEVIEARSVEIVELQSDFDLIAAPNPFTGITNLQYQIPERSEVILMLFTAQGQLVKSVLPMQTLDAGNYNASLSGDDLEAGLYFLILQTAKEKLVKKLVLVK